MEALVLLRLGLGILTSPLIWGVMLAGMVWGIIFGAIPGLGISLALITLLPVVFPFPAIVGLAMLAATYVGATFGGSFSAILLNIPGDSQNLCTTFDGYPMARKGLGGKALQAAVMSSALGGFLSALIFVFVSPPLASFALKFGDADYFGLILMGIVVIVAVSGKSLIKGLISALFGFLLGTVGLAVSSAEPRFIFGLEPLRAGINFVVILIGIYGLGEILARFEESRKSKGAGMMRWTGSTFTSRELWEQKFNMVRSTILGTFVGALPGIGATVASFLGYTVAKNTAKDPNRFGTGELAGVVAPEAANNASSGGQMIPLLSLGIPGGSATAIILAVFLFKGLQPGPLIFIKQPQLVGSIMVALLVANLLALLVGRYGAILFVNVLKVKFAYIVALVGVFCLLGSYTVRHILFDCYLTVGAGVVGYYGKKHDFPLTPAVFALILGPLAEYRFLNGLGQHHGSVIGVLTSPYGMVAMIIGLLIMILPIVSSIRGTLRKKPSERVPASISLVSPFLYFTAIAVFIFLWHSTNSWIEAGHPAIWPRMILGGLILLTIVLIVTWFLDYRHAKSVEGRTNWTSVKSYFLPDGLYVFLPMVVLASYALLQNVVGFVVLTLAFCIVMVYMAGIRSLPMIVSFSVIGTGIISLIFIGFLQGFYPIGVGLFGDFHNWLYDILFSIFV